MTYSSSPVFIQTSKVVDRYTAKYDLCCTSLPQLDLCAAAFKKWFASADFRNANRKLVDVSVTTVPEVHGISVALSWKKNESHQANTDAILASMNEKIVTAVAKLSAKAAQSAEAAKAAEAVEAVSDAAPWCSDGANWCCDTVDLSADVAAYRARFLEQYGWV